MVALTDPCWQFQKLLRKLEYYENRIGWWKVPLYFLRRHFQRKSVLLGLSIPPNVFDAGLAIGHYGSIVVSRHARIGKNCTIHSGVNIAGEGITTIGDNCFLGPGVKIVKPVTLGNNVKIGANAVVDKDFFEDNIVLAGVPAKIVKRI
jgi:serine O-acetyltransferase